MPRLDRVPRQLAYSANMVRMPRNYRGKSEQMLGLIAELRRRSVFRVAAAYLVVAWLIMQVVATIGGAAGLPDWADSLALVLLLAGFPVILFIAWAFELSPDGLKKTGPADKASHVPAAGMPDYALIGALIIVAVIAGSQMLTRPGQSEMPTADAGAVADGIPSDNSIAVLPFLDLSPAGDQQYFSDGISEEILNVLVRIEGLDVTSRTSAFQYRSDTMGVPEIAERLRVRHVLEGSVRRSGNTIRITAQLIDARTDVHLWSQTYDQSLTAENLFAIQDEIANAIVRALSEVLDIQAPEIAVAPLTDSVDAYDLYLQARDLFHRRADLDVAADLLAQAVGQSPDFTAAWALRAAISNVRGSHGYGPEAGVDQAALTESYARQTLALNPDNALAIAVRASHRSQRMMFHGEPGDIGSVLTDLNRAAALNPHDATIHNWLGMGRLFVGDLDGALSSFQTCVQIEARYAACAENYYDTLAAMGRTDEALAALEANLANGLSTTQWVNFAVLEENDERLAFLIAANQPWILPGFPRLGEIYDAYQTPDGDHSELLREALDYMPPDDRDHPALLLSLLLTPLGAEGLPVSPVSIWQPGASRYRQTPAFRQLMRSSGTFDYWREHGFPAPCRPVGADDFACD
ncbi:hypothetical protein AWH62_00400 [Maricaulis sp. W15]|nr:hypothetical protein AWH62_00400 [Maricaulis sp. W15]